MFYQIIIVQISRKKIGEEAFNILYKEDKLMEVAWAYLYKKSYFTSNNFKYAKGLCHEDFGLTPIALIKANKVASTNIEGYKYVQTSESITRGNDNKESLKNAMDLFKHYDNMIKTIGELAISKESKENIKIYYTNCILLRTNKLRKQDQSKYLKEIKKRNLVDNIKIRNFKQFIKKIVLKINVQWYLKLK